MAPTLGDTALDLLSLAAQFDLVKAQTHTLM